MKVVHSLRTLQDLKPGDHACCLYESEEECRAVLVPFLSQGLEKGDKVFYVINTRETQVILSYLRDDGVDVASCLARGQLNILDYKETYLHESVFDPERMLGLLQAEVDRARNEGYSAVRFMGEMDWVLQDRPGSERLIEYEARLNAFVANSQCIVICLYDRRRFEAGVLLDVLRTHPIAVVGMELCQNLYYIPPTELVKDPAASTLQHWLKNLVSHKQSEQVLQQRTAQLEALQQTGLKLTAQLDLNTLLHSVVSQAVQLLASGLHSTLTIA